MSTIDMTQVAGLQAVDAEGNVIGTLSVNDLTELVANNLVKSTQNQVFAARSVSTMSEASTLAVSDEYENNLPIDANPASVRTLDSEGNPKQTAISALAQVVGGLYVLNNLNNPSFVQNNGLDKDQDFNNLYPVLGMSISTFSGGTGFMNSPIAGGNPFGILISYVAVKEETYKIQLFYGFNKKIYIRRGFEEWGELH